MLVMHTFIFTKKLLLESLLEARWVPTGSMTPDPWSWPPLRGLHCDDDHQFDHFDDYDLCHGDHHGNGDIAGVHHSLVNGLRSEVSISLIIYHMQTK